MGKGKEMGRLLFRMEIRITISPCEIFYRASKHSIYHSYPSFLHRLLTMLLKNNTLFQIKKRVLYA